MKKLLSLILAAVLLLSMTAALAQDYTLDGKLRLQLLNGSGLTATAKLKQVNAGAMTALDAAGNVLLRALVPDATLDLRYIRGINNNLGQEDLSLALTRAGATVADIHYTTDGTLEALSSTLFGASKYAANKGDGLLMGLFTGKEAPAWPAMQRAILALSVADNAWNRRAETALKPYTDNLSQWLQGYTRLSTQQNAQGQSLTVNTITIPPTALKAQMKQLLTIAYQDTELLTLLRAQFTPREVAAYLQPSMLPALTQSIDALALEDNVVITRAFDQTGAIAIDQIQLPLGGANGIRQVTYHFAAAEAGQGTTDLTVEMMPTLAGTTQGTVLALSFVGGPLPDAQEGEVQSSYKGSYTLTTPTAPSEGFTVDEAATQTKSLDFTLSLSFGKELTDQATGVSTRAYEIGLLVKPVDQPTLGEQTVLLKGEMQSGAQTNAATRFTGTLTWTDQLTGGSVAADITGSSAAPWTIPTIAGTGAIRLDGMSSQQLAAQRTQLQTALVAAMANLSRSLLPTTTP